MGRRGKWFGSSYEKWEQVWHVVRNPTSGHVPRGMDSGPQVPLHTHVHSGIHQERTKGPGQGVGEHTHIHEHRPAKGADAVTQVTLEDRRSVRKPVTRGQLLDDPTSSGTL